MKPLPSTSRTFRSRRSHKLHPTLEPLEARRVLANDLVPLVDLNAIAAGTSLSNTVVVGSTIFYLGNVSTTGRELWKSDGTAAGTQQVKDIFPGSSESYPRYLTNVNGVVYFTANDGSNGSELWKSDGTAAGTVLVKDIWPGIASATPRLLTNVNGTLFFTSNDGSTGLELWKSDGTEAGTVLVKELRAGRPRVT